MNDRFPTTVSAPRSDSETPIRLLVLGAVYAGAIFFAVVFSPAIGFVTPMQSEAGKIASAEHRAPTGQ